MPRKSEIQAEETVVGSPLRRSSRTATTGAGTPSSIKTRRTSLLSRENEEENVEQPVSRTRRAASVNKEEPISKPEPSKTRGRRSSVNSELPLAEEKAQSITRGRRKSVTDEIINGTKDAETTEKDTTTRKTVKARRGSATQEKVEDVSAAKAKDTELTEKDTTTRKAVRSRRGSAVQEDEKIDDIPPAKTSQRRRSVTENDDEPQKRLTRATRRNSIDKTEEELETKVPKPGTPKKPRRRLSVAELVIPLEPINEQEHEIARRNSKSPVSDKLLEGKVPPLSQTEIKTDLDLSIINETSFIDESEFSQNEEKLLNKSREKHVVSPKPSEVSPKKRWSDLNKSVSDEVPLKTTEVASPKNEQTPVDPSENSYPKTQSVEEKLIPKPSEVASPKNEPTTSVKSVEAKSSPQSSEVASPRNEETGINTSVEEKLIPKPSEVASSKNEQTTSVKSVEEKSTSQSSEVASPRNEETYINTSGEEKIRESEKSLEKKELVLNESVEIKISPGSPQDSKPQLTPIKKKEPIKVVCNLTSINEEISTTPESTLTKDEEASRLGLRKISPRINKNSVTPQKLTFEDQAEKELNDSVFVDAPTVEPKPKTTTTISSGSDGSFSLHMSESLIKTSSQDSQDEEVDLNLSNVSNGSDKENIDITKNDGKLNRMNKALTGLTDTPDTAPYTVVRVSNVFRPKNVDYSFVEPMEVDKTILDPITQLDDSCIEENKISKSTETCYEKKSIGDISLKSVEENVNVQKNVSLLDESSEKNMELKGTFSEEPLEQNKVDEKRFEQAESSPEETVKSLSSVSKEIAEDKSPENPKEQLADVSTKKESKLLEDSSNEKNTESLKSLCSEHKAIVNTQSVSEEIAEDQSPENPKEQLAEVSPEQKLDILEDSSNKKNTESVRSLPEHKDIVNSDAVSEEIAENQSPKVQLAEVSPAKESKLLEDSSNEKNTEAIKALSSEPNKDIVNTQAGSEKVAENQSPENKNEQLADISPEEESKLLEDSSNEENKDDSCVEFQFNVPSDEENEEELKENKSVENDMSTDISVIIDEEDAEGQKNLERIEQNNVTPIVEGAKEKITEKNEPSDNHGPEETCSNVIGTENADGNLTKEHVDEIKENEVSKEGEMIEANVSSSKEESETSTSVNDLKKTDEQKQDVAAFIPKEQAEIESDENSKSTECKTVDLEIDETEKSETKESVEPDVVLGDKINNDQKMIPEKSVVETLAASEEAAANDFIPEEINMPKNVSNSNTEETTLISQQTKSLENEDNTSNEKVTEASGKLQNNVDTEEQDVESKNTEEKVETINIDESLECENGDESVLIVEQRNEIKKDEDVEKSLKCDPTKKKIKRKYVFNVETQDDQEISFLGKRAKLSKPKQRKKKSENISDSPKIETVDEKSTESDKNEDTEALLPSKEGETIKSRLDQYLENKIQEIDNEQESDSDKCSFIDDMAEEGEEDTPSEDSNEIVDEGESINTTESEWSDDDYDDNDSFICDDEKVELLSGEEYDLGDATNDKKKSRIINVDDMEEEVIRIQKSDKKKPGKNRKGRKSRIINVDDCDDDVITIKKKQSPRRKRGSKSSNDNVIIVDSENEEKPDEITEHESDDNESVEVESSEVYSVDEDAIEVDSNESSQESFNKSGLDLNKKSNGKYDANTSVRRASITIHENIKVNDIEDPVLATRINQLVDSFSKTISKGDVSVNLSMQYEGGLPPGDTSIHSSTKKKKHKKTYIASENPADEELYISPSKKPRLSVSLIESQHTDDEEKKSTNSRLSVSTGDLSLRKTPKKKNKKIQKKAKNDLLRGVQNKAISSEQLRAETYSLMNQLLNDVRNRPRRTVKPSTEKDANSSWVVEDINEVRPSTSIVTTEDIEKFRAKKIHAKDFKSQMLRDPSRVKRIETKRLLKKKYF